MPDNYLGLRNRTSELIYVTDCSEIRTGTAIVDVVTVIQKFFCKNLLNFRASKLLFLNI